MTERKDRIEHTLEVLVYAPIGVGLYLKDMGPTFVNMFVARGRAEIDRRQAQVQQRTTTAKSIGQVAMAFGVPMVKQRVEKEVGTARERAQSLLGSIAGSDDTAGAPVARAEPAPKAAPPAAKATPAAAPSDTNGSQADPKLPIPGYNSLSASQVVERLAGLSADELEAVRAFEASNRKRRTILGKIDQISA
jgi:predicted component of type VI protein secretion system